MPVSEKLIMMPMQVTPPRRNRVWCSTGKIFPQCTGASSEVVDKVTAEYRNAQISE
jgi:hypothetical protein